MTARSSLPVRLIEAWVTLMTRHAVAVVVFGGVITVAAGWYAATHLSIDTDNADLISADVGWRRDNLAYLKAFPVYTDNLVVVVDGATPEIAADAGRRLATALRKQPRLYRHVYVPGGGDFFARNGLLYLDTPALAKLSDRLTRIQPFLGRLAAQPTLVTFFSLMGRVTAPAASVDFDAAPLFRQLDDAFAASRQQRFYRLSWQSLTGIGANRPGTATRRFVMVKPRLDYDRLLAAARPMAGIDTLAQRLNLDAEHGVQVRQTGEAALSEEELASVSQGAVWGAIAALLVVGVILYLGLRSFRLMTAALASLIAGLIGTATFAIWVVGSLNLISIAFAVLYIGLGIDYAIHVCLRYREALRENSEPRAALRRAAGDVGLSLLLCAVTTAAGFFAFLPTSYDGVAELGLISGVGMFISLTVSLTFLPALISLMPATIPALAGPGRRLRRVLYLGTRARRSVWIGAAIIAVACASALPYLRFDSNTLNLKNPSSESVATYRDLLSESEHSPLTLVARRPDAAQARRLAKALAARPEVARALTIDDFVPANQQAKLEIIGDMALTLALMPPDMSQRAPPDAQRKAIAEFAAALDDWQGDGEASVAARQLAHTLGRWRDWLGRQPERRQRAILARLRKSVLAGFAPQVRQLMQSLRAQRFTRADLPAAVKRRWLGVDGSYRVEAFARADLNRPGALQNFVDAARQVAPHVTGAPVLEVAAGRTVSQAFVSAFTYAAIFIVVLLLALTLSVADTLRVLAPLVLTGLILCAATVWLAIPFNFANIIALPLLLGLGVDSGIHVVHRLRAGSQQAFLATSTARAVLLSSLTTLTGFGSLAFSSHPGTASMGQLLAIGMLAILVSTLIILPSLFGDHVGSMSRREGRTKT